MGRLPSAPGLVDLRSFLDVLRREGELVTVDAPVDPDLEAAEVHHRVLAAGGPALLFTRVGDSPWPVVTNLFGSRRRIELAFGDRPLAVVQRAVELAQGNPPSLGRLWRERDLVLALTRTRPKRSRRTPVTAVVDEPPELERIAWAGFAECARLVKRGFFIQWPRTALARRETPHSSAKDPLRTDRASALARFRCTACISVVRRIS